MRKLTWFNMASLILGFAFLYIPILLLVIYSFNEGKNVAIWQGFSTKWYGEVFKNEQLLIGRLGDALRVALLSATVATVLGVARGDHAGALRPLSRLDAVQRHGLRAAGDAGDHPRPVAAAAVRRHRFRARLLDHRARPHHLHDVLCDRRHPVAARHLRQVAGGSGARPRLATVQDLPRHHPADHPAGGGLGLDAGVHAVARRPGDLRRSPPGRARRRCR